MSARKQLCVYTHSANGKVFYVGQGTRFRPKDRNGRSLAWWTHVVATEGRYDTNVAHWTDDRVEAVRIESELIAAHPSACNVRGVSPVESERFEMRISRELLALIDAWAQAQPDNPPRATAFKRLVTMALEAEERKAARGKK